MKRQLLPLVLFCLTAIAVLAQTPAFMGIPIEGNINDFYKKIEAKGFTLDTEDSEGNIYSGIFTGEDVTVSVMPGYENKVAMVGVYLPVKNNWKGVLADFDKYSKMYTAKYGEPDIVTREFAGYTPGSNAFHDAIINGGACYRDIYVKGDIFITLGIHEAIISDTSDGYQFMILYLNDNNFIDEDDYQDDI